MMRSIRLFGCIVYCLFFGGCGGSGRSSARVTREKSTPYYSAIIEWNIARDIDENKIDILVPESCDGGWCQMSIDVPTKIINSMIRLASSQKLLLSSPAPTTVSSVPRPLLPDSNSKYFIHESIHLTRDSCTEIQTLIEYHDEKIFGKNWLENLPLITIGAAPFVSQEKSENRLSKYPQIMWYVRRCSGRRAGGDNDDDVPRDLEYCRILYRDENFVPNTNLDNN